MQTNTVAPHQAVSYVALWMPVSIQCTLKSMGELYYKGEELGPVDHLSNQDTTDKNTNFFMKKPHMNKK